MIPVCVCGHGFDHHFSMVPVFGLPGPRSSRCMECDCTDKREAAEQSRLVIGFVSEEGVTWK